VSTVLECRDLRAGYGKVAVIRSLDLAVSAGEVVAVLGPNGAGKTTLLETLAGLLPRLGGEVSIRGVPLASGRAPAATRAGLVLVPDDRALFTHLTVEQNLEVARPKGAPPVRSMLEVFPALEKRWTVARGLVQRPRVLLVDEMSMGLAPVIVEELLPVVRRIADGTEAAVVLVEQHVHLALAIADRAVVLVHGSVALTGSASELSAEAGRLEAAYLGDLSGSEPAL
jgi:branched-chain amino acid transport system ATP-binding protein